MDAYAAFRFWWGLQQILPVIIKRLWESASSGVCDRHEVRGSLLLHEKGGLEGVPYQERVIFTVPNEHHELMGDSSLEGSTSPLSHNSPLSILLIWRHSSSDDSTLRVQNFGFASRLLLLRARNKHPEAI